MKNSNVDKSFEPNNQRFEIRTKEPTCTPNLAENEIDDLYRKSL